MIICTIKPIPFQECGICHQELAEVKIKLNKSFTLLLCPHCYHTLTQLLTNWSGTGALRV